MARSSGKKNGVQISFVMAVSWANTKTVTHGSINPPLFQILSVIFMIGKVRGYIIIILLNLHGVNKK